MTSRERLQAALHHKQPDRIPKDLGSTFVTGVSARVYEELKKTLGLAAKPNRIIDPMQMLSEVDLQILNILGCDIAGIHPLNNCFGTGNYPMKDWKVSDNLCCRVSEALDIRRDVTGEWTITPPGGTDPTAKIPNGQYFFDLIPHGKTLDPDELTIDLAQKQAQEQFSIYREEELRFFEKQFTYYTRETDLGIVANLNIMALGGYIALFAPGINQPAGIRDSVSWYMALALNQDFIKKIFSIQVVMALKNLTLLKQVFGEDGIDAIFISGTDFGTQEGPLISNDAFRELYKPHYRMVNDWIHENTSWKTFYHSCGSVFHLMDDFIDMGVDILNPIQFSARAMERDKLADTYGDSIVFWGGGVDTQNTLPHGTLQRIRQEVSEGCEQLGKDGGFIFAPVHNVLADVPAAQLIAAYDAVTTE